MIDGNYKRNLVCCDRKHVSFLSMWKEIPVFYYTSRNIDWISVKIIYKVTQCMITTTESHNEFISPGTSYQFLVKVMVLPYQITLTKSANCLSVWAERNAGIGFIPWPLHKSKLERDCIKERWVKSKRTIQLHVNQKTSHSGVSD